MPFQYRVVLRLLARPDSVPIDPGAEDLFCETHGCRGKEGAVSSEDAKEDNVATLLVIELLEGLPAVASVTVFKTLPVMDDGFLPSACWAA